MYPLADIIAELLREVAMRQVVYPRQVAEKRLTAPTAAARIAKREQAAAMLQELLDDQRRAGQRELFPEGERMHE